MEMLASTSNDAPWVSNTVFSDCKVYGSWLFLFSTHYGDGAFHGNRNVNRYETAVIFSKIYNSLFKFKQSTVLLLK